MATLTIRDVDDDLKDKLRVRAARHGRSMEAEVRSIVRAALTKQHPEAGMGNRIRRRFADVPDAEIDVPSRAERPRAAELPE
ncbi:FitA-like ribbon-helix-helix domain-containing protein [Haloechinothrix sp. LS1_15]|uniref:FitA-like ribbon-helix-helix domain-containing protein n=1 Tax=Haloechinothrix sp. LS1_15 TaxID=2652248 RepID=UPI0029447388|nr:Arc family DNA-binding protein [Haloechinothrix sp. LS1_15]MDV6011915.1 Arc family DNA-binding protein [Haloechinothrix sp. LS1_15]